MPRASLASLRVRLLLLVLLAVLPAAAPILYTGWEQPGAGPVPRIHGGSPNTAISWNSG